MWVGGAPAAAGCNEQGGDAGVWLWGRMGRGELAASFARGSLSGIVVELTDLDAVA
jgi:hypothetical protein